MVDELSKVTDGLRVEEHAEFALDLVSFLGPRTALVYSGSDTVLARAIASASGIVPDLITLDPIMPSDTARSAQLLPLKSLFFNRAVIPLARSSKTTSYGELSAISLLYEMSKTTPGMLGAITQFIVDSQGKIAFGNVKNNIPIANFISQRQAAMSTHILDYCRHCVQNEAFPDAESPLGAELLRLKIGALKRTAVCDRFEVFIPPSFAYFALTPANHTQQPTA